MLHPCSSRGHLSSCRWSQVSTTQKQWVASASPTGHPARVSQRKACSPACTSLSSFTQPAPPFSPSHLRRAGPPCHRRGVLGGAGTVAGAVLGPATHPGPTLAGGKAVRRRGIGRRGPRRRRQQPHCGRHAIQRRARWGPARGGGGHLHPCHPRGLPAGLHPHPAGPVPARGVWGGRPRPRPRPVGALPWATSRAWAQHGWKGATADVRLLQVARETGTEGWCRPALHSSGPAYPR